MDTFSVLLLTAVLLSVQLLLCFRVKSIVIRLLPSALLLVSTLVLSILAVLETSWNALAYMVLAMLSGIMLAVCGLGWGIWAIFRWIEKRKN